MSKNGLWKLFEHTGLPEAYLAYKEEAAHIGKDTEKDNGEQV
jgi:hypothetical protein